MNTVHLSQICRIGCLVVAALLCTIGTAWPAAPPLTVPLGSPDFRPTPRRPFGWRGDGNGRFPGATPVTEWSATRNVRWSTVVGSSYSSPILTEKCAVVTAEPNFVVCVDRADGKQRWKVAVRPADLGDAKSRAAAEKYKPPEAGAGMVAATPVTDGATIYALLANGILAAIDLDGKPKWTAFVDARRTPGYGRSASPILSAGKLIVHMTSLYAFDPATGKQLWMNDDAKSNYGTPLGLKIGGVELIVTAAGDVVRAADGTSVNSAIGQSFHASPIVHDDLVYFGEGSVAAVRLNARFKDKELWNQMLPGDVFGSPLLHDGLLFLATGKGELYAFDASDKGLADPVIAARPLFDSGSPGGGSATPIAYASITLAGKNLFLNSNQGDIVVLEAAREAKQVAKNHLPDGSGATPVFSGSDMFLRDGNKLFCIGR